MNEEEMGTIVPTLQDLIDTIGDGPFSTPLETFKKALLDDWQVLVFIPDAKGDYFWAIQVPSSQTDHDPYTVILDPRTQEMECGCKGFAYRGDCRHLILVKQKLAEVAAKKKRN